MSSQDQFPLFTDEEIQLTNKGNTIINLVDRCSSSLQSIMDLIEKDDAKVLKSRQLILEWLDKHYQFTIVGFIKKHLFEELPTHQMMISKKWNEQISELQKKATKKYFSQGIVNNIYMQTFLSVFVFPQFRKTWSYDYYIEFKKRVAQKYIKSVASSICRALQNISKKKDKSNHYDDDTQDFSSLGKRIYSEFIENEDEDYETALHMVNVQMSLLSKDRDDFMKLKSRKQKTTCRTAQALSNLYFTDLAWMVLMDNIHPTIITAIIGNKTLDNQLVMSIAASSTVHTFCLLLETDSQIQTIVKYLRQYQPLWHHVVTAWTPYGKHYNGSIDYRPVSMFSIQIKSKRKFKIPKDVVVELNKTFPAKCMDAKDYNHSLPDSSIEELITYLPDRAAKEIWLEIGSGYPKFAFILANTFTNTTIIANDRYEMIDILLKPYPPANLPFDINVPSANLPLPFDINVHPANLPFDNDVPLANLPLDVANLCFDVNIPSANLPFNNDVPPANLPFDVDVPSANLSFDANVLSANLPLPFDIDMEHVPVNELESNCEHAQS